MTFSYKDFFQVEFSGRNTYEQTKGQTDFLKEILDSLSSLAYVRSRLLTFWEMMTQKKMHGLDLNYGLFDHYVEIEKCD